MAPHNSTHCAIYTHTHTSSPPIYSFYFYLGPAILAKDVTDHAEVTLTSKLQLGMALELCALCVESDKMAASAPGGVVRGDVGWNVWCGSALYHYCEQIDYSPKEFLLVKSLHMNDLEIAIIAM